MSRLTAILKLTRIEHSIMLVIAVFAAEILAKGLPSAWVFIMSLIAPIFISMGSFAINDYFDIKVDKLNRKRRPLVEGTLWPADAVNIAAVSFAIGIGASAFINIYAFAIALAFAALAFLYSYILKETLLLGNIYIAFTMVIPFIFGNYVVSTVLARSIILISAMVFLSGLAREIHGTIRDYKGDVKVRKAISLPRTISVTGASVVALWLYLFAIALSAYLFISILPFELNLAYLIPIGISDAMLLYVGLGYVYKKRRVQEFYEQTRDISLFAMGLALIAIALSTVFYI